MLPHLPALRQGKAYTSLDQIEVKDCRTGAPLARVSQVNAGIIRRDLAKIGEAWSALKKISCNKLVEMCREAAGHFLNAKLPLGDQSHTQSPEEYVKPSLPRAVCRTLWCAGTAKRLRPP
jgi:hypothetical protein